MGAGPAFLPLLLTKLCFSAKRVSKRSGKVQSDCSVCHALFVEASRHLGTIACPIT